jgi:hypothetical protein
MDVPTKQGKFTLKGNNKMRVTNVEKFRKELFDNLKVAMFGNCSVLKETRFERHEEQNNLFECCALYDCLEIKEYFNPDKKFYVVVNDDECDVTIWKLNKDEKFFRYVTTVGNTYYTKVQFMMSVAVELQRATMNH